MGHRQSGPLPRWWSWEPRKHPGLKCPSYQSAKEPQNRGKRSRKAKLPSEHLCWWLRQTVSHRAPSWNGREDVGPLWGPGSKATVCQVTRRERAGKTTTQNYFSLSHLIPQLGKEGNLSDAGRMDSTLSVHWQRVNVERTNSNADKRFP